MKRKLTRDDLLHLGSMITYLEDDSKDGKETCLGYLMNFTGHGVFDPTFGKVDITHEEVKAHNDALDQALLKGLDENCEIGHHGTFYLRGADTIVLNSASWKQIGATQIMHNHQVTTFMGTEVSDKVIITGINITFFRMGKTYRGRLRKDAECFNFRRVA